MITIGITGGYATGKTLVAGMFKRLGAKVLFADRIAHRLMRPNTPVWKDVVGYFGQDILKKNGWIDRDKLARVIFADPKKRAILNKMVHPVVIEELKRLIQERHTTRRNSVLVVEIPLLFEVGLAGWFTKTVVVTCKRDVQYIRAERRDKISRKEILQRVKSQWPLTKKERMADFVIDNSGSAEETMWQVKRIWEELMDAAEGSTRF